MISRIFIRLINQIKEARFVIGHSRYLKILYSLWWGNTINPSSGSIVLLQFNDSSRPTDVKIITGHAIKRLSFQTDQQQQLLTMNLDIVKEKEEINQDELKDNQKIDQLLYKGIIC